MDPIEALVEVLAAERNGKVRLPRCVLRNGLDVGAEFAVALAMMSGLLPSCKTYSDVVRAAHRAAEKYMEGGIDRVALSKTMISLMEALIEVNKKLEAMRVAESN